MPEGQRVFAYIEGDRLGVWVGTVEKGRKMNKYKVWIHEFTKDGFRWVLRYLDPELVDVDSTWDPKGQVNGNGNGNGAVSPPADLEPADSEILDPDYYASADAAPNASGGQPDEYADELEGW